MAYHRQVVSQWTAEITTHLPQLSAAQATVLALWSLGLALARSGALTAVAGFLAAWRGRKANTVRQQLREFCYAAADKAGSHRQAVVAATCFVGLLRWVLAGYAGPQLALARDATSLGDRCVALALSVVYRGCAVPVAWTVLPAGRKRAWREEGPRLVQAVRPAVPAGWTVIVLADRGL
jgi:hypothetical protein